MRGDATKLRGFFGHSFNEQALLHQRVTSRKAGWSKTSQQQVSNINTA